jgi:hypothetical protein
LPPATQPVVQEEKLPVDKTAFLIADLSNFIPKEVEPLNAPRENSITEILTRHFGFRVTPEIYGIRLDRNYGYIGAEQHLMRFPGDTMATHFENPADSEKYYSSGMAPGLGGWGYFARSRADITREAIDEEKYYIAVQTFLAPGFAEHTGEYISFFKFRKMLVVNPENGRAMVVVIGDAGPGIHTGKQFGGSPEVMIYLNRVDGAQKGPVLVFFIDDPSDSIPLGPVEPI